MHKNSLALKKTRALALCLSVIMIWSFTGCSEIFSKPETVISNQSNSSISNQNAKADFTPFYDLNLPVKSNEAKYWGIQPTRASLCIGKIDGYGNGNAGIDDILQVALKEATKVGADYITIVRSGTSKEMCYGLEISRPWAVLWAWIFLPSDLGLKLSGTTVTGFKFNSDAERSGIQIGDVVLGIDNYDINDHALQLHLLEVLPETHVTVSVKRSGSRHDFDIIAMPN